MQRGAIIGIVGVLLIIVIVILVYTIPQKETETKTQSENIVTTSENTEINPKTYTIEMTSFGFSPRDLSIKKGDTVIWINKDTVDRWPASAMHPTHTVYPGVNYDEAGSYLGSLGCKGEGQPKTGAFDPCKNIKPGESWSFIFNQQGSWNYHDHIATGNFGKINVE